MDSFDNFQYDSASSYGGIGVVDDTSSIYTSGTQSHVPVDIESLSILDDHAHPTSSTDNDLELQSANGSVTEDFDAVLDDLKEESQVDLPPHACWFVLPISRLVAPPLTDCSQLLRHTQPCLRRKVSRMFQVVLQFARQYIGLTYCQSLGPSQAQGSYPTRREPARRDHSRVL